MSVFSEFVQQFHNSLAVHVFQYFSLHDLITIEQSCKVCYQCSHNQDFQLWWPHLYYAWLCRHPFQEQKQILDWLDQHKTTRLSRTQSFRLQCKSIHETYPAQYVAINCTTLQTIVIQPFFLHYHQQVSEWISESYFEMNEIHQLSNDKDLLHTYATRLIRYIYPCFEPHNQSQTLQSDFEDDVVISEIVLLYPNVLEECKSMIRVWVQYFHFFYEALLSNSTIQLYIVRDPPQSWMNRGFIYGKHSPPLPEYIIGMNWTSKQRNEYLSSIALRQHHKYHRLLHIYALRTFHATSPHYNTEKIRWLYTAYDNDQQRPTCTELDMKFVTNVWDFSFGSIAHYCRKIDKRFLNHHYQKDNYRIYEGLVVPVQCNNTNCVHPFLSPFDAKTYSLRSYIKKTCTLCTRVETSDVYPTLKGVNNVPNLVFCSESCSKQFVSQHKQEFEQAHDAFYCYICRDVIRQQQSLETLSLFSPTIHNYYHHTLVRHLTACDTDSNENAKYALQSMSI